MAKRAILIAEKEKMQRQILKNLLSSDEFDILEVDNEKDLLHCFRHYRTFALLVFSTSIIASSDDQQLPHYLRTWASELPVIVLARQSSERLAIASLKAGVFDYFPSIFLQDEFKASVLRCLSTLGKPMRSAHSGPVLDNSVVVTEAERNGIIGKGAAMRDVKTSIEKIAFTDSTVLITGETGTGKELVASAIHHCSSRRQNPFVDINCAAIPESLLESELFGYERGAFTGANTSYEGKLRYANGGTIFFDEIGEMSPYAQAKMLRTLESRRVQSLGAKTTHPIDVRVVAATNQNLDLFLADGKFRKDLYYRLNVARIDLPPLRDRQEDIPALCNHFIQENNHQFGRQVEGLTEETLDHFLRYDWPGNVRELRNLIEALFVHGSTLKLSLVDLPAPVRKVFINSASLPHNERAELLAVLLSTNWNKSQAAQKLHWSRVTLYRKMWKHHLVAKGETTRSD